MLGDGVSYHFARSALHDFLGFQPQENCKIFAVLQLFADVMASFIPQSEAQKRNAKKNVDNCFVLWQYSFLYDKFNQWMCCMGTRREFRSQVIDNDWECSSCENRMPALRVTPQLTNVWHVFWWTTRRAYKLQFSSGPGCFKWLVTFTLRPWQSRNVLGRSANRFWPYLLSRRPVESKAGHYDFTHGKTGLLGSWWLSLWLQVLQRTCMPVFLCLHTLKNTLEKAVLESSKCNCRCKLDRLVHCHGRQGGGCSGWRWGGSSNTSYL